MVTTSRRRTFVLALAAVLAMTILVPIASYASPEGNRNTAIGLAGAAAYLLIKGKTLPGVAAAAGAAYAYNRSQKERQEQRDRDRWGYYGDRYRYNDRYDNRYDNRYNPRYGSGPGYYNRGQCQAQPTRPVYRPNDRKARGHDNGNHYGWERGRRGR